MTLKYLSFVLFCLFEEAIVNKTNCLLNILEQIDTKEVSQRTQCVANVTFTHHNGVMYHQLYMKMTVWAWVSLILIIINFTVTSQ